jgi:hypothetical protein
MFFSYALADALAYMRSTWLRPTHPHVLATVSAISAAAILLVKAGVL